MTGQPAQLDFHGYLDVFLWDLVVTLGLVQPQWVEAEPGGGLRMNESSGTSLSL
jgi:hypothetical protein